MNFCQSEQLLNLLRTISAQLQELEKTIEKLDRSVTRADYTVERTLKKEKE